MARSEVSRASGLILRSKAPSSSASVDFLPVWMGRCRWAFYPLNPTTGEREGEAIIDKVYEKAYFYDSALKAIGYRSGKGDPPIDVIREIARTRAYSLRARFARRASLRAQSEAQ